VCGPCVCPFAITVVVLVYNWYKTVHWGGSGTDWRTCAMRYDEPRVVWTSVPHYPLVNAGEMEIV